MSTKPTDLGNVGRLLEMARPIGAERIGGAPKTPDLATSRRWFGDRSRMLRKRSGLTLQELSARTTLRESTLSKIENGKIAVTYDNIVELAHGLRTDVSALLSPSDSAEMIGRRTIMRAGAGVVYESDQYKYEILCAEISRKKFIPLRAVVKARSILEFGELTRHRGEEFIHVLSGAIRVYTEGYEPAALLTGDSIYFDSVMGHAAINDTAQAAEILWVCTNAEFPSKSAG